MNHYTREKHFQEKSAENEIRLTYSNGTDQKQISSDSTDESTETGEL